MIAGSTALAGITSAAPGAATDSRTGEHSRAGSGEARGFYDARTAGGVKARAKTQAAAAKAFQRPAARALALGGGVLLDFDGGTGTPRFVGKLDGYLTAKSRKSDKDVALDYVRKHRAALGMDLATIKTLKFRDRYVDVYGTSHLSWQQLYQGDPVFGYGLQAAVDPKGRLVMLGGAPIPASFFPAPIAPTGALKSADAAILAARKQSGEDARVMPGDTAKPVAFFLRGKMFRGWQTVTMGSQKPALSVFDSATGRLLYRRPLSADSAPELAKKKAHATGTVFKSYPDPKQKGGDYTKVDFTKKGWLKGKAKRLKGNNAHAFSDVNDDNAPQRSEEVGPRKGHKWNYKIKSFNVPDMSYCDNPFPCTWNPNKPFSWKKNRKQNTTQVFFFVNNFHDVLLQKPVGFTEDAGNFEQEKSKKGQGGDAVSVNTLDGANTDSGLPDGDHIDNANMNTPPDGIAPTMQMYLQHQPGTEYSEDGDPFPANNTGDQSDTVYHEYTHGLSNRLVISPTGESSLGPVQAGSMGEAWSDFYALAYLVKQGYRKDKAGKADVPLSWMDGLGSGLVRTEPIDCKVGQNVRACNGGATGHRGGYTYADYGKVIGLPEVHADGEIWGQTLWDLKDRIGYGPTLRLVTRAMELSPYDPSMLDQRNGLLQADTVAFGGKYHQAIWSVFAKRGMGFYAGALGGGDASPAASFKKPPATIKRSSISGTVTDSASGDPVEGVPVTLKFQGAGGMVNPTAVTDADGTYTITKVPQGTYQQIIVNGAGYEPAISTVTVGASGGTADFAVVRDWAASSGGASIADFTGPDFTPYGCGPGEVIDLSQASGWGSSTGADETPTNVFVPKYVVIELPEAVDVDDFAVDPSATCGDGGSASTGGYTIETSPNGTAWTTAASGTFTVDDRGAMNTVTPTAGTSGVQYVKFTFLSNQTPDFATNCPGGAFSGCTYTDVTEIAVHGTPAG